MNESKTTPDFRGIVEQLDSKVLVVNQSEYDFFISQGCSPDLLHLNKPIPLPLPTPQPKDWYRKHA